MSKTEDPGGSTVTPTRCKDCLEVAGHRWCEVCGGTGRQPQPAQWFYCRRCRACRHRKECTTRNGVLECGPCLHVAHVVDQLEPVPAAVVREVEAYTRARVAEEIMREAFAAKGKAWFHPDAQLKTLSERVRQVRS